MTTAASDTVAIITLVVVVAAVSAAAVARVKTANSTYMKFARLKLWV